eukprot:6460029-Amphidinium_carterae.1
MQLPTGPVTGLVEVNDGFSLGHYAGISASDYTDLFIARWCELLHGKGRSDRHTLEAMSIAFAAIFAIVFGWRL